MKSYIFNEQREAKFQDDNNKAVIKQRRRQQ